MSMNYAVMYRKPIVPKSCKFEDEIPDDSTKYRLEYENNGLLLNDRLFQRQLFRTQTESVIDTINILKKITIPSKTKKTTKSSTESRHNQLVSILSSNQRTNLTASIEKQQSIQSDELLVLPNWSLSAPKNNFLTRNLIKNDSNDFELPIVEEKRFICQKYQRSCISKTCNNRLRNLLDNGTLETTQNNANNINDNRLKTVIVSDSSNGLYLKTINSEKQMKQIDAYRKFKSELGYNYSRRLPITNIQTVPDFLIAPKFLIRPKSKFKKKEK